MQFGLMTFRQTSFAGLQLPTKNVGRMTENKLKNDGWRVKTESMSGDRKVAEK